jgi:hypothetical protein
LKRRISRWAGFEVDAAWANGVLTMATIRSLAWNVYRIRNGALKTEFKTEAGKAYDLDGRLAKIGPGQSQSHVRDKKVPR